MMELTDYTVFLWLLPLVLQVILPLTFTCFALGFFFLRPLRMLLTEQGDKALDTSSA